MVPLLGESTAAETVPVATTAAARPSPSRAVKTPQEVVEERDDSIHSSKQKIKVVVARRQSGEEEEEVPDEELVE